MLNAIVVWAYIRLLFDSFVKKLMVNVWFSHMICSFLSMEFLLMGLLCSWFGFKWLCLPGDMMHIKLTLILCMIGVSILKLNAFIIQFMEMVTLFDKVLRP